MAEGIGGDAAALSFFELTQSAGRVVQSVRARISPPGTRSTWLGQSAQLAEALAGSVLRCSSLDTGSFWAVIPPRAPSGVTVRRLRGIVTVRVSRDGAQMSAKYEELHSFHEFVQGIVPGVVTMGGTRGALTHTVKLLTSGVNATITVSASPPASAARPHFTVTCGDEVVIGATPDFAEVIRVLSVREVPWSQFATGEWWGLPTVDVAPVTQPMSWAEAHDALGIAAVFGLPPVSSNIEALQFLLGCCEPPPSWMTVEELSHACGGDAPEAERAALAAVLRRMSAATQSRPDVVDSVHSRLRAITQSEDAPELFVAFGRAWRQGALEPPQRQASRSASPSSALAHRRASRTSPPRAHGAPALDAELDMMSPNTMRSKLRLLLAEHATAIAARPTASAAEAGGASGPVASSPASGTRRSPSPRVRHSGQLGGLFAGGLAAVDPSLTVTGTTARPPQPDFPAPPVAPPAPQPTAVPTASSAPAVESVLSTISPDDGPARATRVVIPTMCYHLPVTAVVQSLAAHGMPDVVAQLAHAAGDTALRATPGSSFEALSLLRHIEEVFADVSGAAPSFSSFLERPAANSWHEAVDAIQVLLGKHSSVFRAKRQRGPSTAAEPVAHHGVAPDDKPPVGSFKQVAVATASERTGACDAQLLEELASSAVLRREHVRSSVFCTPNVPEAEREAALPGELAHFCSTYGQAATAYLLSNGTSLAAISGYGVPMALAAIRLHLLARVTQLIHTTVGFERALMSMNAKCTHLATGFLSGVMELEDCVTILGGSAPHEEAEVRREGGALSSGTLGTVSGDNAQLSIREALAAWGHGLHLVMGDIPGISASGIDFAVSPQLKKIPRDLGIDKLLSVCRYMIWNVGVALSRHRTIRGAPLPDVCEIVTTATTKVFRERELDQRSEERASAVMGPILGPMLLRLQQLEAAHAKGKSPPQQAGSAGASSQKDRKSTKPSFRSRTGKSSSSTSEQDSQPAPSAQEAAQQFLMSLHTATPGSAAAGAGSSTAPAAALQSLVPSVPSPGDSPAAGASRITSRQKALMELSAVYRRHVGMDPKGDPAQEPCSYRALFGKCGQSDCARCQSGKSFPRHMVEAVKARCLPTLFNDSASPAPGGQKGGKEKAQNSSK